MIILNIMPVGFRGRFAAFVGKLCVVRSSRTPFLDAARALLAAGLPAETLMTMRHPDRALSLKACLGAAAVLRVVEGEERPRFRRWNPMQDIDENDL